MSGEVAEMMLTGIMCQQCGEYMGDEVGYPRTCRDCARSMRKALGIKPTATISKRAQKRAAQAAHRAERNKP